MKNFFTRKNHQNQSQSTFLLRGLRHSEALIVQRLFAFVLPGEYYGKENKLISTINTTDKRYGTNHLVSFFDLISSQNDQLVLKKILKKSTNLPCELGLGRCCGRARRIGRWRRPCNPSNRTGPAPISPSHRPPSRRRGSSRPPSAPRSPGLGCRAPARRRRTGGTLDAAMGHD